MDKYNVWCSVSNVIPDACGDDSYYQVTVITEFEWMRIPSDLGQWVMSRENTALIRATAYCASDKSLVAHLDKLENRARDLHTEIVYI